LPRAGWQLLAAGSLSAVANGLTYPFLVVYLHRVRELPLGLAGMAAATIAVAAIVVNLAAGPLVGRLGPRRVAAGMLLLGAPTVTSRRVSVPTGSPPASSRGSPAKSTIHGSSGASSPPGSESRSPRRFGSRIRRPASSPFRS
jgi:hypothetical protein